jgi:hypothetical protein
VGVGEGVAVGVGTGVGAGLPEDLAVVGVGFAVAVANTTGRTLGLGLLDGVIVGGADPVTVGTRFRRACEKSISTILYGPSPMGWEL